MTNRQKFGRESVILIGAVALMTLKIVLGMSLVHRMKVRALRAGEAFVEDDD